jgi:hypothetical protein
MLTAGNHKLGGRLIWGFGLPSARQEICTGMTSLCRRHCYERHLEPIRPDMLALYESNLCLSCSPDFGRRIAAFLVAHQVEVVRIHTGGEFYSASYASKWLRVMDELPDVRFYFYTRAWRDESIRPVVEQMAERENCRIWYSVDQETGLPENIPPRVRLAWLMTTVDEQPPPEAHLVFRIGRLRRHAANHINGVRVCPAEDGFVRTEEMTCDRCGICWRPLSEEVDRPAVVTQETSRRMSLTVLPPGHSSSA